MANPMLEPVSPADLANIGQVIETKGNVEDFRRLAEIVDADLSALPEASIPQHWQQATVDITLRFGWIEARPGVPALEGRVATKLAAVCQRCLEPFILPLSVSLKMLLVRAGDDIGGYDEFESWEIEEDQIRPFDIVEEALIMALPLLSMHPSRDQCGPLAENIASESVASESEETVRPFADLKSRMNKTN
jgi:uncharacterized metal-binding protein YceD (DUF177 family)